MENDKDLSSAAVRGEAVAGSQPNETLQALKDVTDVLDAFGDMPDGWISPKAWNSQAAQEKIDAARSVLARAADAPSEPSERLKLLEEFYQASTTWEITCGHPDATGDDERKAEERFIAAGKAVRTMTVKSRAADALDSQPTDHPLMRAAFTTAESGPDGYFLKFKFPTLLAAQTAHREWLNTSTQPTVAAQQGSIADDQRFLGAMNRFLMHAIPGKPLTPQASYVSVAEFINSMLDSRASSAPVAPIAPNDWKLVPIKLTQEMIDAIEDAVKAETSVEWDTNLGGNTHFGNAENVYQAMLNASPAPQQEGSEAGNA